MEDDGDKEFGIKKHDQDSEMKPIKEDLDALNEKCYKFKFLIFFSREDSEGESYFRSLWMLLYSIKFLLKLDFLRKLCKEGFPHGNIFEYAA